MKSKFLAVLHSERWLIPSKRALSLRRLASYWYFQSKKLLRLDYSFYPPAPSKIPIDIYMPTVEKDAAMLALTLESVRQNIMHPIENIYIVAPSQSEKLKAIAAEHGCRFIDETQIIELDKNEIDYKVGSENRNGWIYKMLLNLAADTVCKNRYILILDADTVFIAPQIFVYNNRPLFNVSDEYHIPYFEINERILGFPHKLSRSFITHYMLFDAEVLQNLRKTLETKWDMAWYQSIINQIDKSELSGFADYEIYGDFYMGRGPVRPYLNYWSNISLSIAKLSDFSKLAQENKSMFRSISLHNYAR